MPATMIGNGRAAARDQIEVRLPKTTASLHHVPKMMNPRYAISLLADASTTGDWLDWDGGDAILIAGGDFNGAVLRVEFQDNQGETIVASPLDKAGHTQIALPRASGRVRGVLVGGNPNGIWATLTAL
jgi:hypothetical protein